MSDTEIKNPHCDGLNAQVIRPCSIVQTLILKYPDRDIDLEVT